MTTTPLSVNKFRLVFAAWWIVWTTLHITLLFWLGFTFEISGVDSIVTNVILAATCALVSNNLRFYLPQRERYWYIFFLSLIMSALSLAMNMWILSIFGNKGGEYLMFITKSLPVRFSISFLLIACMAMISVVWYTFEEQKEADQRRIETDRLTKEAELYKLRQQLQPHFLFNSLNSISALIASNPGEARAMVYQLSDFLRSTLRKEEQQWITLTEELHYLQLYLSIEKVRFGQRLTTIIESEENCGNKKLPNMLLQPIVENAIKFSIYDATGDITIRIKAAYSENYLQIIVQNPFDPETSQSLHGTGFGLSSIQRRLQLLFVRNDLLSTHTHDRIFTTSVTIPQP